MKIHKIEGLIEDLFLAEYEDRLLLLDGGCRADVPVIEDYITGQLGRSMDQLKLMVVTHAHPDHAGAAPFLRKKYDIPIASLPAIDRWYRGISGKMQHLVDMNLARFVARKKNKGSHLMWYPRRPRPDILLYDSDPLPGFTDWTVYHTPGHTFHDLVLFHPGTRTLYASDLIISIKGKLVLPYPVTLHQCMERSLTKVKNLSPDQVLVAHGGIVTVDDPEKVFQSLLDLIPEYGGGGNRFPLLYYFTRLNRDARSSSIAMQQGRFHD